MSPKKTPAAEAPKGPLSKGQTAAADVAALLRARNSLLWIGTREEARVEGFIVEAAAAAGYKVLCWDIHAGIRDIVGREPKQKNNPKRALEVGKDSKPCGEIKDPVEALDAIQWFADRRDTDENGNEEKDEDKKPQRIVWIMRDLPIWLDGMPGATPLRALRNLSKALPGVPRPSAQAVIILTTSTTVPADLSGHATVVDWPLPDRSEIAKVIDAAISNLPDAIREKATTPETRELAIDAAVGLTAEEAASCFAKSLVLSKTIDPVIVMGEKKRVISREKVLTWHDPIPGGLDAVGGLDGLKSWLAVRKTAYSKDAREYGLPAPKGAVLVGITGCGKSLTAKAVATAWQVPLLRLDLGALKAKYVGDSESNIRKAFKVVETIDHCVLWIDEIEKAMAGSSSGASDGGVSADALGVVLNWMQERTCNAFVIATANDVEALPPELFRKGRFDEIFYVGLPNTEERHGVLKASLIKSGRGDAPIDFDAVVDAANGFTGAEIAELVPTALYVAYEDNAREITTEDLINAAEEVNPVSKTKAAMITKLDAWGKANARSATSQAKAKRTEIEAGRVLDLE